MPVGGRVEADRAAGEHGARDGDDGRPRVDRAAVGVEADPGAPPEIAVTRVPRAAGSPAPSPAMKAP